MRTNRNRSFAIGSAVVGLVTSGVGWANVNLELRPASVTVNPGQAFELGLYAVSESAVAQEFVAADVIFTWERLRVRYTGNLDNGVPLLR